jgi:hypothetical protein
MKIEEEITINHGGGKMAELEGMKVICDHVKRSEATVLDWIRFMAFPAKKLGGIWVSDTELISDWKKKIITSDEAETKQPKNETKKSDTEKKTIVKESQKDKILRSTNKKNGKKRR